MIQRPRRNRKSIAIRSMLSETQVKVNDLFYPLFIVDGNNIKDAIPSMPNIFRWSLELLLKEVEECMNLGITN